MDRKEELACGVAFPKVAVVEPMEGLFGESRGRDDARTSQGGERTKSGSGQDTRLNCVAKAEPGVKGGARGEADHLKVFFGTRIEYAEKVE